MESDRLTEFVYVVAKEYLTDSVRKAFSSVNIKIITVNNFELESDLHCFRRVYEVNFEDMNITD